MGRFSHLLFLFGKLPWASETFVQFQTDQFDSSNALKSHLLKFNDTLRDKERIAKVRGKMRQLKSRKQINSLFFVETAIIHLSGTCIFSINEL